MATSCYPVENFLDEIDVDKYTCMICFRIIRNPVVDPCKHTFSSHCINLWIKDNHTCPMSRLSIKDSLEPFDLWQKGGQSIRTRCLHYPDCSWQGFISQIEEHLTNEFTSDSLICTYNSCGEEFLSTIELKKHLLECPKRIVMCVYCNYINDFQQMVNHLQSCSKYEKFCPNVCGMKMKASEIAHHKYTECVKTEISCPFESFDCSFKSTVKLIN